jgi:hypothetical protein
MKKVQIISNKYRWGGRLKERSPGVTEPLTQIS